MVNKIKCTYYYETETEREAIDKLIHIKTLDGFTLRRDTKDERKGVGRVDMVKTVKVVPAAVNT